jgi:hypothetical protein
MGATSEHFSNAELQCHSGCGRNECTQGLVDALEALRALAGKPISIDSAYRCPEYNASLPNAAQHSQHVLGNAADIVIEGMTPAEMEALALRVPAIHGMGRADFQGYLHVDVRPEGVEHGSGEVPTIQPLVQWCYDKTGNECAYYPPVTTVS